jgi:hypothetical protein
MTTSPGAPLPPRSTFWTWAALLASLVTLAGSLYLSIGMGLKACPLCFYQRTFVMGVVGVLLVGVLTGAARGSALSLLSLPAAVGGVGVAAFHVYLELNGQLECPKGIGDLGTAPQQSLVALVVLLLLLLLDVFAIRHYGDSATPALLIALVLGGLLAWGAIASAPPSEKPTKPYDEAPRICRVPYNPPSLAE